MTTNAIITKTYNDNTVLTFRNDGWFNMTKAAKAFGKELKHFWTRPDTVALLDELKKESADSADYYETARGYNGGTWAHPELAVEFARWLDVKFARWCNAVIKDILTGAAQVNIVKPETSEILKMPTSMLEAGKLWLAELERAEALKQENVELKEENAALTREVNNMTITEFKTYCGHFFSKSDGSKLSYQARKLAKREGREITKIVMLVETSVGEIESVVNVYPRDLLVKAYNSLFSARAITV